MMLDDDDERLWFKRSGRFEAEVVPERDEDDEDEGQWVALLESPDEMVQFYDPTDLFGDLAETLAEQYPEVAAEDGRGRRGRRTTGGRRATKPTPDRSGRGPATSRLTRPA